MTESIQKSTKDFSNPIYFPRFEIALLIREKYGKYADKIQNRVGKKDVPKIPTLQKRELTRRV
ncbi:MAG: hypothetical protein LBU34_16160, partial [Planctomycetaceae bacterium]|nr:hypothetical protein [Planctomycetaceae bacterium]